jgi:hypothetical protein
VTLQQLVNGDDAGQAALAPATAGVVIPHTRANIVPFGLRDAAGDTAVGHDLNALLGHQHVEQHAGVVLGIPDLQLAEHLACAQRRVDAFKHHPRRQS